MCGDQPSLRTRTHLTFTAPTIGCLTNLTDKLFFLKKVVPEAGFEPASLAAEVFETSTSTNSITRANKTHLSIPRPPASVGSSYHEFQKLTRLSYLLEARFWLLLGNLRAFLF